MRIKGQILSCDYIGKEHVVTLSSIPYGHIQVVVSEAVAVILDERLFCDADMHVEHVELSKYRMLAMVLPAPFEP